MRYLYFTLLCVAALLCGCGEHKHDAGAEHSETESHEHEEGVIHLTTQQAQAAELATETVVASEFEDCIRVSGQVTTAQGDELAVTAKSSGIVSFVRKHLAEGVAITSGEALATISASDIEGGDAVAQQRVALETARVAFERAKALMTDTLISQKEYDRLKQEYEVARLSVSRNGKGAGSSVVAPLTGFIRNVLVKEGEYVEAGAVVAIVTKSCNLQLRAEVPEKYFKQIKNIHNAYFEMSYGGGIHRIDSLHGHLVSAGQMASDQSAYIPVTFEFVNDGCMVAGSFADIWLLTDTRSEVISVPSSAISEEQGVYYVYVMLPEEEHGVMEFEKKEVRVGLSNGLRTEIVKGIKPGERVVTQGVTQVKLAGASGAIPEAHSHSH